jgi:energy-coupling factor transporter ATP-binding protein EcfA2
MFNLPVSARREVRAVSDPSWPLMTEEMGALHEDLSSVQGGDRIAHVEQRIRDAWETNARELLTGHAGCGKSTELTRLANELRKERDGRAFHVVYVDAYEYLNPFEIRLPQLIVSLMAALAATPRVDLKTTRSGPKLWDQLLRIFKEVGREAGKDLTKDLPLLPLLFKVDLHFVRSFRQKSDDHIQTLLKMFSDLVLEVRSQLPPDQSEIVFIVDNLEKIPNGETELKTSLHETLFLRELPLLDIPAHLILTYPISLNYSPIALRQVFRDARQTTIPMVGIRQKSEVINRGDDRKGIAALRKLLDRRIKLDQVFANEAAIEALIRESGGCVRDLLRLMGELPTVGAMPFSVESVESVIADYVNEYERILQGKPYLPLLHMIERTGAFPEDTKEEWKQQLLLGLIVLEYDTGTWYDVHPLAKHTRAYRLSVPEA